MGEIKVRVSDELHDRIRAAAREVSVTRWVVEAISEKLGRTDAMSAITQLLNEIAQLHGRIEELERHLGRLP